MNVVIDTNIIIDAAGDENSYAHRIIREVVAGRIFACATHQTMKENHLLFKQSVFDQNFRKLIEVYFHHLQIVPKPKSRVDVVWDKEDNKLFESALSARADFLITSDKEVLNVGKFHSTKVVSPSEFWAIYKERFDDSGSTEWDNWAKMVMDQ